MRRIALITALAAVSVGLAPAAAQEAGSGLAITPAIVETHAAAGTVGRVTVSNTTGKTLKISVTTRPWIQSSSGAVSPDQRHTLPGVRVSPSSFTLGNGAAKTVSVSLSKVHTSGSMYGNIDVLGVPTTVTRGVVTVDYRLIGALRLDPTVARYGARAVSVTVRGTHRSGEVYLAVQNTGNTVTPISGTVRLSGSRGSATGTIAPVRIVPGVTVSLPALRLSGSLPAGAYTLSSSLHSGRATSNATAHITLK